MIMDTILQEVGEQAETTKKVERGKRNFDIAFLTDQDASLSPLKNKRQSITPEPYEESGRSAFTKVVREPSVTPPQPSFSPTEKPDMSLYLRNISSLWLQPQESFVPFMNQSQLFQTMTRPYQNLLSLHQSNAGLQFLRPKVKEAEDPAKLDPRHIPGMMPTLPQMVPPVFAPSLMSPSLAALAMTTTQNVCAKCNLSFRMTSDLVYHMRSQHRPDGEQDKAKRVEKLKCTVCGETFRERHHLTRHMTSHTDKDRPNES